MSKQVLPLVMLTLMLVMGLFPSLCIQHVRTETATIIVPDDYPTIQEAINAANEADTVFVRNGTYYENVVVNKTLSLIGEEKEDTIIDNQGIGSYIIDVQANNVMIKGFTVRNAHYSGQCIWVNAYVNCTVSNNIVAPNTYGDGIRIHHSSDNIIEDNLVTNSSATAIGFDWAHNNTIHNNTVIGNYIGIGAGNPSYDNVFSENTIANNSYGFLTAIYNSKFLRNNIMNNSVQAAFYGSGYANAWDDGYPPGGNYWSSYAGSDLCYGVGQNETGSDGVGDSAYTIDAGNVDNYPLMRPYVPFENQTIYIRADGTVDPSGAPIWRHGDVYTLTNNITSGIVIERSNISLDGSGRNVWGAGGGSGAYLQGVSNVSIRNLEVHGFYTGIQLEGCSYCSISGNIVRANTGFGIFGWDASYCEISGNVIMANGWTGLGLSGQSKFNLISGNDVESNSHNGIHFFAASDSNEVSGNTIAKNNHRAISLDQSGSQTIRENVITSNGVGVLFYFSSNNTFYHNSFVDNGQSIELWTDTQNQWDNGYPSGGNYWSDCTDSDFFGGAYQNETGSDGLGDEPYALAENNIDHYALMAPLGVDVAVLEVNLSKMAVGQGDITRIYVTVKSQGFVVTGYREQMNLSLIADDQLMCFEPFCAVAGEVLTITFTWNTTGFAKGNYTTRAFLEPLSNETETHDNLLEDGNIVVVIPGDVSASGVVNMIDLYFISWNFAKSQPYASLLIANCDIDDNGIINMLDLYIAALHFGETDP
jgi:parallel beta-helix repeat protein